jgi:Holliday junction resolvasome RuvABC endonuclease subunit
LLAAVSNDWPLVQVDAQRVKQSFAGSKSASKQAIIDIATSKHPHLPWRVQGGRLTKANEHLADAVAVAEYGVTTPHAFEVIAAWRRFEKVFS